MTDSKPTARDEAFANTGPALLAERIRTGTEPGPRWWWDTACDWMEGQAVAQIESFRRTEAEVRQGDSGDRNVDGSFRTFEPNSTTTPGACEGPNPVGGAVTASGRTLTIEQAQRGQPWTVPYSPQFVGAAESDLRHLYGSHTVLHAVKSVGKLAAVFEAADHRGTLTGEETIAAMSADLMTAALRFANLYGFSLADALRRRVLEKNGVEILTEPPTERKAEL